MRKRFISNINLLLCIIAATAMLASCGDTNEVNNFEPEANDNSLMVLKNSTQGSANQVDVSTNDDIGGNGSSGDDYSLLTKAENGTATHLNDGIFEYIPNTDYVGEDVFKYRLTDSYGKEAYAQVVVRIVDEFIPIAQDNEMTVKMNSTAGASNQIDVSENDDIGGNGSSGDDYSVLEESNNGTLNHIEDGIFEYIPNQDYQGEDRFTYKLTDSEGKFDEATVTITITKELTEEDFENIDPNFPSFVSINNTTPEGKVWVKQDNMSDEFESGWDNNKWFRSVWNYDPPVFMSNGTINSGVADGNLWIKATLNESNPEERWFQTARIHSRTKISYPMYTEASIKAAHISAYNTYWLNNGDIDNRDEIDIIENNSKPSCDCQPDFPMQMNSQYFHADSNLSPKEIRNKGDFNQSGLSDVNPKKGVKWNEDYHTFGVWWKDSKNIQFYLNGEPAGSVVVGEHNDGTIYEAREFTRELEIIFDLWTGDFNWLGGLALKEDLQNDAINTMKVDWVRTWKLEDE
ncbi:Ig-like domain-containing protein [Saccharicrinis aurantiacus]|uniref:Ig-like domain-containing protein n=1 Tax=Saccharicrinis aurantiacus TaxID=1849719 RepID=UPI00094F8728|nr:Ig-like domain-containing protein [Saccharicrinis aurantiacus]